MTKKIKWDREPVPPELWGKDHFSTLVYLETRIVDGDGRLKSAHMRTKSDGTKYPTRLDDGTELVGHDDWDCVRDLEHAGYVTTRTGRFKVRPGPYALTDAGWNLAGRCRRHLGERPNCVRTYDGFEVASMSEAANTYLICGSRGYPRLPLVRYAVDRLPDGATLVVGDAAGVDAVAARAAKGRLTVCCCWPAWDALGRAAGPVRNRVMVRTLPRNAQVVCFWDGVSAGTKSTIDAARSRGDLRVRVFGPDGAEISVPVDSKKET